MKKLLIIGTLLSNIAIASGNQPNYIPERNRDVDNSNAPRANEPAAARVIVNAAANNRQLGGAVVGAAVGGGGVRVIVGAVLGHVIANSGGKQ